MKTTSFLIPLIAAAYVSAHGILAKVTINGRAFNGPRVGGGKGASIVRQVSTPNPNKGASNPALTCGPNAGTATLVADAQPGDNVSFDWRGADGSRWPHNTGPMLTYMASCGATSCDKFNAANAQWFKIQQIGRKGNSATWAQQDLMNGGVASATIPRNLAPGNYLIRHEIIALHLGTSRGGAEFYPACAQLRVGGTQTGRPAAGDLVRLPGAYKDSDPGIFAPNVFNARVNYVFPGPAIARFASAEVAAPAKVAAESVAPVVAPVAAPATNATVAPATGDNADDKTRSVDKNSIEGTIVEYLPRHASRIMRRAAFEQSLQ